jgi:riboflavin synthase
MRRRAPGTSSIEDAAWRSSGAAIRVPQLPDGALVFTGIVKGIGRVESVDRSTDGVRVTVATPLASELGPGDSIAVNGVCLTAAAVDGGSFVAEVMNETLAKTSLSDFGPAAEVNLELPLRASDRLGGHFVQGHVDGVGVIAAVLDDGFARRVTIRAPGEVLRYIVEKGSVAVDGVSLTVVAVGEESLEVSLIPETLERTSLGRARAGTSVNLEVDMIAKYVEKAVGALRALGSSPGGSGESAGADSLGSSPGGEHAGGESDRHTHGQGQEATPKQEAGVETTTMEAAG